MFRFIHAADLHLDSPLRRLARYEGAPADEIKQASRRALSRLVDLAIERQVDFVLIAGDIYDGDWKDQNTGLFFVKQMARLKERDIPVVVIAGNHDAANLMSRHVPLPANVRTLGHEAAETFELPQLGVAIHGQSFAERAVTDNLAAAYPPPQPGRFNIGLLHTCAEDANHERYAPCSVAELAAKGYQYWALGHVHQRQQLHPDPPIWFSGNLQGRHPKETGAKGCLLVEVNDLHQATVTFEPTDVFRWESLTLEAVDGADAEQLGRLFVEQLESAWREHDEMSLAVRVTVRGVTPHSARLHAQPETLLDDFRAHAAALSNSRIWVEKLRVETQLPPAQLEELPTDGPIGELLALLDEWKQAEAPPPEAVAALADLRKQLPPELREAEEPWFADDSTALVALLDEAAPLLLTRLAQQGAAG